jgi:uncharacterized phage protein (TIGR01671 family)
MKEHKFKAWFCDNEKFVEWVELVEDPKFPSYFNHPYINNENLEGERVYLLEYTGIKDRNGKEIYEGDILLYEEEAISVKLKEKGDFPAFDWQEKYLVEYLGNSFKIKGYLDSSRRYNTTSLKNTIIGNAFENPELLN